MNEPSVTLHQQDGVLTLLVFADREGLTVAQAAYLAKRGKILGATKIRNGGWMIYPPAKLLSRPRVYEKRQKEPQRPAELPNPLAAVPPFGRSTPEVAAVGSDTAERSAPEAQPCPSADSGLPEAYSKAQGPCRTLALASSEGFYPVVLSGRQVLLLERALAVYAERLALGDPEDDFGDGTQPRGCADSESIPVVLASLRNATKIRPRQSGMEWREYFSTPREGQS